MYLFSVVPWRRVPSPLLVGRRVGHHLPLPRQPLRRGTAVSEVVLDAPRVSLVLWVRCGTRRLCRKGGSDGGGGGGEKKTAGGREGK